MREYGLLFYLSGEYSESDALSLQQMVTELASTNRWTMVPPEFVDNTSGEGPEPIRTVGGFLPLSPPHAPIDRSVEKAHFEEVERVVGAISSFSATTGCEFELELGGVYAGDIADGKPDTLVTTGLLDEWRKHL